MPSRAKGQRAKPRRKSDGAKTPGCLLPHTPDDAALRAHLLDRSERAEAAVIEYAEWQLSKGTVKPVRVRHLERLKAERVFGREIELWDVHTTDGRWWVVTEPTNIYPQAQFPSADYMLSFHIGLTARVMQRDRRTARSPASARFVGAFRRWEQAAHAIDEADEAEDVQAIGMKCRECLLTFARDAQSDVRLIPGAERPKRGDFVAWSRLIADWAAPGDHSKDIRQHLKQLADSTWQLVNWLTHARNAVHAEAELAVSATRHLLDSFCGAIVRFESKQPERCPKCSSYQMDSFYAPELEQDPPYVLCCRACGWEEPSEETAR
jgi:hypothetical protein